MSIYEAIALAMVCSSLGIFAGHAVGYGKGLVVGARRMQHLMKEKK